MLSVVSLVFAILFTALAQISYKLFFFRRNKLFLVGALVLFCCIPLMSYLALKGLELSTVYISTAVTYVLVLILARFILKEVIERQHMIAVGIIIVGVLVFNY